MLNDTQFFIAHPDRLTRIRLPNPNEEEFAFASLGSHRADRRRILIQRVPDGPHRGMLMPIPFVLFSDESVEDTDAVLLPVIREIMLNAAKANDNVRRR
jgi:hypothetical protein